MGWAMAHDVFLSYSYQDKASADAVCHSLESKGIRCWIAPRDVIPGENWQQSILDAIAEARAVILLFTGHTNQSENVKKEVSAAFDANAMVIPFRIEDVTPQGSLKYVLIGVHWLDAYQPPLEEHVSHLAKIIQNLPPKNGEAQHEPIPAPLPPPLLTTPPQPQPQPAPAPAAAASAPTSWDAVSLDRREGFAFLAAIIPFAPGLYLLWRTTYRNDGDKVAPVSQTRKLIATGLAVLVIFPVLLVAAQLLKGHATPSSDLSSAASDSSSSASSAASSAVISAAPADSSAPVAAAWSQESTDGKNREVKFVNQSNHAIYHLYAWLPGQTETDGRDLMGPETIQPGAAATYKVDDGRNDCDYNFRATRADNAVPIYVNGIRVCSTEQVILAEPIDP